MDINSESFRWKLDGQVGDNVHPTLKNYTLNYCVHDKLFKNTKSWKIAYIENKKVINLFTLEEARRILKINQL